MTKIEQIQNAISEANLFRSKLSPEALQVPGFTSLKIRHLMNNLGAISSNYLDCGSHKGGTYCSTVFNNTNLQNAICIDDFREFNGDSPMIELLSNAGKFKPESVKMKLIQKDVWAVTEKDLPAGIDLYLYDSDHSLESQYKSVSYFLKSMADEFIFVVDDYSVWPQVKEGTEKGLKDSGLEILFQQELYNGIPGDNWGFHQGLFVALLRKP